MVVDPIKRAINGAYAFCEEQQAALDNSLISEEQWFENHKRHFTNIYLASDNPRGQSGHGGDESRYRYTQEMILSAVDHDGTFIDVGCANGLLMERLATWSIDKGLSLDFYGVDISEGLLDLAKKRLSHLADHFYLGNALYWTPPQRYTYVCVKELDYVPKSRRKQFFKHLLEAYVAKEGRLILGPWTERRDGPGIAQDTTMWGFPPSGSSFRPHQDRPELERRLYWYEVSD